MLRSAYSLVVRASVSVAPRRRLSTSRSCFFSSVTTPSLSSAHTMNATSSSTTGASDVPLGSLLLLQQKHQHQEQQQQQHQNEFLRTHHSPLELRRILSEDEEVRNDLAYCLSFSADDMDFSRNLPRLFQEQLENSRKHNMNLQFQQQQKQKQQQKKMSDNAPLPRTLQDALRPSHRAIVMTECHAPFRIVDVNRAWEHLCGYSHVESKGKTLGSLLRGPETNSQAATSLIAKLLQGEEAGITLTNYTKDGRRFRNRLRVGPLYNYSSDTNEDGVVDHHYGSEAPIQYFVGVLQEVQDGM